MTTTKNNSKEERGKTDSDTKRETNTIHGKESKNNENQAMTNWRSFKNMKVSFF